MLGLRQRTKTAADEQQQQPQIVAPTSRLQENDYAPEESPVKSSLDEKPDSAAASAASQFDMAKMKVKESESRKRKIIDRIVYGALMISLLLIILYGGHVYTCGLVAFIEVLLFQELVRVRYSENFSRIEDTIPLFRTTQWSWFVTAIFYTYSDFASDIVKRNRELHHFSWIVKWQTLISFGIYSFVFVLTIATLQRDHIRFQINQLCWTIVVLFLTVGQLKYVMHNIFNGLIWFALPVLLVVSNDIFAYVFGMLCGRKFIRRPLIKMSPNKTWEGFIGAFFSTMVFGWYMSRFLAQFTMVFGWYMSRFLAQFTMVFGWYMSRFLAQFTMVFGWYMSRFLAQFTMVFGWYMSRFLAQFTMVFGWYMSRFLAQFTWMTCPVNKFTFFPDVLDCDAEPIFLEAKSIFPSQIFELIPSHITRLIPGIVEICSVDGESALLTPCVSGSPHVHHHFELETHVYPIQIHSLALSLFASLVAPFGGFLASAIKRAYGVKDFASMIPGHGGMMDRMDCQFLMALCTWVHYNAFVKIYTVSVSNLLYLFKLLNDSDKKMFIAEIEALMKK
eukprot:CAMPEP_0116064136 /NCGR_PEP_ID=MMETSP0322-20121206/8899_1 /TAXON_ID=163516 /ORGANISM="Leptocylindrus danicus var. apora, Strain B651" /LENGTH=560 /DNA_ID=CAMNT_0003550025 /DNA_START=78 /DNA_END=1760 /DNA_ORIENTATION=+